MTPPANPDYKIRTYRPEDFDQVRHLFGKTHLPTLDQVPTEHHQMLRIALGGELGTNLMNIAGTYAAEPNTFIIICPKDDEATVAAYCALVHHSSNNAELKNVIVDPDLQGLRLGTMLMDAFHDQAKARGYRSIFLWTYGHLATATGMYKRRGYVHKAHDFSPDVFHELRPLYMEKDLLA